MGGDKDANHRWTHALLIQHHSRDAHHANHGGLDQRGGSDRGTGGLQLEELAAGAWLAVFGLILRTGKVVAEVACHVARIDCDATHEHECCNRSDRNEEPRCGALVETQYAGNQHESRAEQWADDAADRASRDDEADAVGSLCERVEVGSSRAVHHRRPLTTAEDDRAEHQQGVRLRHDCQCADDRTDRQQCESCRQDGEAAVAVTDATSHPQRGHAR